MNKTKAEIVQEAYAKGIKKTPEIIEYGKKQYDIDIPKGTIAPTLSALNKGNGTNRNQSPPKRQAKRKQQMQQPSELTVAELHSIGKLANQLGGLDRLLAAVEAYKDLIRQALGEAA